jgi:hypothetical protein
MVDCRANQMSRKSTRTARRGKPLAVSSQPTASETHGSAKTDSDRPAELWRQDLVLSLLLVVVTMVAYLPAWQGTPIWDDDAHLTRPELRSLEGLVRIWTQLEATQQYYPLLHSLFWGEHQLWGDWTLGISCTWRAWVLSYRCLPGQPCCSNTGSFGIGQLVMCFA